MLRDTNKTRALIAVAACAATLHAGLLPAYAAVHTNNIVASDNAYVFTDTPDDDMNESALLYFKGNPRQTSYLRFDVSLLDGATNIVSATLDLHVNAANGCTFRVLALNDGYTNATRWGEVSWTSVLAANEAPAFTVGQPWPEPGSSAILTTEPFSANGTTTHCDLASSLLSLLTNDTNGEITFILVDTTGGGTYGSVHSLTGTGTPPTLSVVAEYAPGLRAIDVTPGSHIVSTTTDYSAGFTYDASDAATVTFNFSAFGTGGSGMDLSGCSSTIGDYTFGGFTVDPTGVTVDNNNKTITFTGGTLADGAMTIDNASPGTGWRIVNVATPATQSVTVTAGASSENVELAILSPVAITALSPANNASRVWPTTDLVATFNRNITLANGGTITVTNLTQGTATVLTAPDYGRLFAGGDNHLTISLYKPFHVEGNAYAVQISSGAVVDTYGHAFAGISDTTTWRFSSESSGDSIVASDNAWVCNYTTHDSSDEDMNESATFYVRGNPRHSTYLRFNVRKLAAAIGIRYASLDLHKLSGAGSLKVVALKDGYTDATRESETGWTSVLTANNAPAYATWPNSNSSAVLASRGFNPSGTITTYDLTSTLFSLLESDTNGEITLIVVDASFKGDSTATMHSLTGAGEPPTLNVIGEFVQGTVLILK